MGTLLHKQPELILTVEVIQKAGGVGDAGRQGLKGLEAERSC
jgi:hypothetical protein